MKIRLLPRKFIYLGWLLLVSAFICATLPLVQTIKITLATQLLTAGLLVLALVKQKEEDEMSIMLRLQAWLMTVIYISVFIVVQPIIDWLFDGDYNFDLAPRRMMILIFLFYFMAFWFSKRHVLRGNEE